MKDESDALDHGPLSRATGEAGRKVCGAPIAEVFGNFRAA